MLQEAPDIPDGEVHETVVERVIEKEKTINPSELQRIRKEVEESMKNDLVTKGVDLPPEEIEKVQKHPSICQENTLKHTAR